MTHCDIVKDCESSLLYNKWAVRIILLELMVKWLEEDIKSLRQRISCVMKEPK